MKGSLVSLWSYRGYIVSSVRRDFQSRYQNSLLGAAWTVINPLAMILVYTVIFSQIMRTRLPGSDSTFSYSIYLCAGLLTWGLFAEILHKSQTVFIDNANFLKKINFPSLTLPTILLFNSLINFSIIFSIFLVFLLVIGTWPGWILMAVFPVLLIQMVLAMGLGIILGILNVFFRDVGQFFGVFLQFWFWLTPVVYPAEIVPHNIREWLSINPMMPLITAYQDIFVQARMPNWPSLMYPWALGLMFSLVGWRLYRRHSGDMVDEL
jgi:lipopolysaccharide transport system permease protein